MEKNELMPQQSKEIISKETLCKYLDTFTGANALEPKEREMFLEVAIAFNLNPFKREIYCIAYGKGDNRKLSIIVGYETYLKRAESTGKLNGWKVWTEGSIATNDLKACIAIKRKDWEDPFCHEVFYSEYVQMKDEYVDNRKTGKKYPNAMWASKPITMLKKVVIAQSFRLCFSEDMGGLPYTADELPPEMSQPIDVTPKPQEPQKLAEPKKEVPAKTAFEVALERIPKITDLKALEGARKWIDESPALTDEQKTKLFFMCDAKENDFQDA